MEKIIFVVVFVITFIITAHMGDLSLCYTILVFLVMAIMFLIKESTSNQVFWNSYLNKSLFYIFILGLSIGIYALALNLTTFNLKEIMVTDYKYIEPNKLMADKTNDDKLGLRNIDTNRFWFHMEKEDVERFKNCKDKTVNLRYVKGYDLFLGKKFYNDDINRTYETLQVVCDDK